MVWRELIAPSTAELPENVSSIWYYSSTEMINNAIDHSGAAEVQVGVRPAIALRTEVVVSDEGSRGSSSRSSAPWDSHDPRESILELAKGKLDHGLPSTTRGEGIFFTSRALDSFEIESHHLRFRHRISRGDDSIVQSGDRHSGNAGAHAHWPTTVRAVLREVFDAYTASEEFTFDKTVVPLRPGAV